MKKPARKTNKGKSAIGKPPPLGGDQTNYRGGMAKGGARKGKTKGRMT